MEERRGSCSLMEEGMIRSISCPLLHASLCNEVAGLGCLLHRSSCVSCWPHLARWGAILQPPVESGALAISSDLDVWNYQGLSEVIRDLCWRIAFLAWLCSLPVAPRTVGLQPHTGPGHPEAPPRVYLSPTCHYLVPFWIWRWAEGWCSPWTWNFPFLCPETCVSNPEVPAFLQRSGCSYSSLRPGPERRGKPQPQSLSSFISFPFSCNSSVLEGTGSGLPVSSMWQHPSA